MVRATGDTPLARMSSEKRAIRVADVATDPALQVDVQCRNFVALTGARSTVYVPMLKDDALIGVITIFRQEVRPFTDKQLELLTNFAAQAVIAIENTRLLSELRQRTADLTELLERQTATSEVLRVISSSPGELQPVFDSMLANATRICEAKFGLLYRFDGKEFHLAAAVGTPPDLAEFQRQRGAFQPRPGTRLDLVMRTKQVISTADVTAEAVPDVAANWVARDRW